MSATVKASVDLTDFNKAFEKYMELTSRTLQRACNDKLFDIARFALKGTRKAVVGDIRATLNAHSDLSDKVTLAELLVIMRNRKEGNKVYSIKKEAKTLINKRAGAAGYTRSGWIKPMVALMPYIGKGSLSIGGVSKNIGAGGAQPVARPSSHMQGAVWNDVSGISKDNIVQKIKEDGAQVAIDKVTSDMTEYILRKLESHNQRFNK